MRTINTRSEIEVLTVYPMALVFRCSTNTSTQSYIHKPIFFIDVGLGISIGLCQCERAVTVKLMIVGNLCRCTGYRPILDGFNTFTKVIKS